MALTTVSANKLQLFFKMHKTACSGMNGFVVPIRTTNTAHETTSRPPDVGTGNTSATSAKNTVLFVPLLLVNGLVALISGVRSFRWILVTFKITFTIMAVDAITNQMYGEYEDQSSTKSVP